MPATNIKVTGHLIKPDGDPNDPIPLIIEGQNARQTAGTQSFNSGGHIVLRGGRGTNYGGGETEASGSIRLQTINTLDPNAYSHITFENGVLKFGAGTIDGGHPEGVDAGSPIRMSVDTTFVRFTPGGTQAVPYAKGYFALPAISTDGAVVTFTQSADIYTLSSTSAPHTVNFIVPIIGFVNAVEILVTGSNAITFKHNQTGNTGQQQKLLCQGGADLVVNPGEIVMVRANIAGQAGNVMTLVKP